MNTEAKKKRNEGKKIIQTRQLVMDRKPGALQSMGLQTVRHD